MPADDPAKISINCPHCRFAARFDSSRIPAEGIQLKCPKCKGEFALFPPPPPAPDAAPAPATVPIPEPEPEAPAQPAARPVEGSPAPARPRPAAREGKDFRKHRRIPFAVNILVNKSSLMKAIDLSEGGLYVHTGRSFHPGSIVDVELPLEERKITVRGKVQHNQSGIGMGIKFVELSGEHLAAIREYMQRLSAGTKHGTSTRKRILLVDEDAMKRRMNKSKLMLEGFSVTDVEDGIQAIQQMNKEAPDLVILDLFMKRMDGFKVLAIIKESPQWGDIPVLVYSAKGTDDVMEKVMAAGATEFLLKMMTPPAKLAEIVKNILAPRR